MAAASECFGRALDFENLDPGIYNVTVFEGRLTDGSQFAKIWVGDSNGSGEPTTENTGNFAHTSSTVSGRSIRAICCGIVISKTTLAASVG
jgi:hypothetical protein